MDKCVLDSLYYGNQKPYIYVSMNVAVNIEEKHATISTTKLLSLLHFHMHEDSWRFITTLYTEHNMYTQHTLVYRYMDK